jgi:hypothetical protein
MEETKVTIHKQMVQCNIFFGGQWRMRTWHPAVASDAVQSD